MKIYVRYPHLRLLLKYYQRHIRELMTGVLMIMLTALLILPAPFMTRYILDRIIPAGNLRGLIISVSIMIGVLIVVRIVNFHQNLIFLKLNNRIILKLKMDLLNHIYDLSFLRKSSFSTGYLVARINEDTQRLQSLFVNTLTIAFKDILSLLTAILAMVYINWRLAVLALVILPVFIFMIHRMNRMIRFLAGSYFEESAQVISTLEKSIRTFPLIKALGRKKYSLRRFFSRVKKAYRSNIKLGKASLLNLFFSGLITGSLPMIIILFGGYEIISREFSIGSLIAFNAFAGMLFGPAGRLININLQIQRSYAALERIGQLLLLPVEPKPGNLGLTSKGFRLAVQGMSFSYNGSKRILSDINLQMNQGDKIALTGFSGCGKSTLLKLISGMYSPDKGNIILNEQVLDQAGIIALRTISSFVSQEPHLVEDSIYNNIRLGKARVSEGEIVEAARQANAWEFIEELPDKMNTVIGRDGFRLSIGQKQRIALARGLVRKPLLLLLDEITSNIDVCSEHFILNSIFSLPSDIMVIFVTHRVNILNRFDRVIVMDKGRISDFNTPDKVVNRRLIPAIGNKQVPLNQFFD